MWRLNLIARSFYLPIRNVLPRSSSCDLPYRVTTRLFNAWCFSHPSNFWVAPAEIRDSKIFCIVNIDWGKERLSRCINKHSPFGKFPQPFSVKTLVSRRDFETRAMRPQRRVGNGKRSSLLNQGPAASSQGPAASANSGDEGGEFGDEKSVRSQTLEGQCFTQISISWPMMSIGQWRLKHTSMQQQPGHFVSWLRETENNWISTTSVCSDHCASMKWSTFPAAHKLNCQKGVDSQTRDMVERSMFTCGKAAGARVKRKSRARKEASAQEVRGYYNQFAEAKHIEWKSPGLTMWFLTSLI